ncbi:hypothetical protein [Acidithiobacillus marinus]|nr:hypothetical protein [Acidithiobacillus marinus]
MFLIINTVILTVATLYIVWMIVEGMAQTGLSGAAAIITLESKV